MGRVGQSGARRAPCRSFGNTCSSAACSSATRRAAKRICRCNGPPTAASCATRRRAASSAPDRTRIPFSRDDLYDDSHRKRIAPRLAHLPRPQTLALVRGLLESDGGVSRGAEIYFTSASQPLAEGLRYQCLRLGVPVSGQVREREHPQDAAGDALATVSFHKPTRAFDLRIPAVPEIAALVGCKPIGKRNWITLGGTVFSRVRARDADRTEAARRRPEGRRRRVVHDGRRGSRTTAASARAPSARTSRRGTSTSRNSSSCARTPATIAAARTT